jgi:hypothetical protein
VGLTPGSWSSEPAPTTSAFPLLVNQGIAEPQTVQNAVLQYLVFGSSKRLTLSSPRSQLNWLIGTKILAALDEPVFFLHLLQWQYWNPRNGPSIRNATAPHTQEPRIDASIVLSLSSSSSRDRLCGGNRAFASFRASLALGMMAGMLLALDATVLAHVRAKCGRRCEMLGVRERQRFDCSADGEHLPDGNGARSERRITTAKQP